MKFINFGSLNIDKVYQVPHFVQGGETVGSLAYAEFPGGKGLNQSIALSRAGGKVKHVGAIGQEGQFLKTVLEKELIDTSGINTVDEANGHAIIQVNEGGNNCILTYGGANKLITIDQIDQAFACAEEGDVIVLQNEIRNMTYILEQAVNRDLQVVLTPSPINPVIKNLDFNQITYLALNESEGYELTGHHQPHAIIKTLRAKGVKAVLLTLGSEGAIYADQERTITQDALRVKTVDTTAAGDTFLGYFMATLMAGNDVAKALEYGVTAAAISVTKEGASSSIPHLEDLVQFKL